MSAISSRDGSEKCIPEWPIAMPSHTPGTENRKGTPPPAQTPHSIFRSKPLMPMWPGTRSVKLEHNPMKGFFICVGVTPDAWSSARLGIRSRPSLI